jgi:hypothetical protein
MKEMDGEREKRKAPAVSFRLAASEAGRNPSSRTRNVVPSRRRDVRRPYESARTWIPRLRGGELATSIKVIARARPARARILNSA